METETFKLRNGSKVNRAVIYTITSLGVDKVKRDGKVKYIYDWKNHRSRLVGWYTSLEEAKKCVENDSMGFDEAGYYNFIVIERVVEGIYNMGGHGLDKICEWWYTYTEDGEIWVECKKPKIFKDTCDFWGS